MEKLKMKSTDQLINLKNKMKENEFPDFSSPQNERKKLSSDPPKTRFNHLKFSGKKFSSPRLVFNVLINHKQARLESLQHRQTHILSRLSHLHSLLDHIQFSFSNNVFFFIFYFLFLLFFLFFYLFYFYFIFFIFLSFLFFIFLFLFLFSFIFISFIFLFFFEQNY